MGIIIKEYHKNIYLIKFIWFIYFMNFSKIKFLYILTSWWLRSWHAKESLTEISDSNIKIIYNEQKEQSSSEIINEKQFEKS
jgi:hypothetical protein